MQIQAEVIGHIFCLVGAASAVFTVSDPSDQINPRDWTADNALLADYTVAPEIANVASNMWSNATITSSHKTYSVDANDTSVVVIAGKSTARFNYDTFIKQGYSTNLIEASFWGVNAAVWVGNASTAHIQNSNITVHNGAANVYSYGTDTVVYVDDTFLYSSGPVSHGLYASGNGTVYGSNIRHYSGGYRSSAFSGDNPAGYVHVSDSVTHTDGLGSAICYALGLCNITNVIGHASSSPTMFMDSNQEAFWKDCDLTAGKLAGMVLFGSSVKVSGAELTLDHTRLTVLGSTMANLWFGNTIANVNIKSSSFNNSASGIFLIANMSQVTQDFDHFAGYEENSAIAPAEVMVTVSESVIPGNIVAYNGSTVNLALTDHSSWTGAALWGYGNASIAVSLDSTSNWTLIADSTVQNLTTASGDLSQIFSNGFNLFYNSSAPANSWLKDQTVTLQGGGKIAPIGTAVTAKTCS
ncbi:hypothetical protein KCU61_g8077, partial [Aureobasidium melanogenum]